VNDDVLLFGDERQELAAYRITFLMLFRRWTSWNRDKLFKFSSADLALGRFEIGDVDIRSFAELLPLPF